MSWELRTAQSLYGDKLLYKFVLKSPSASSYGSACRHSQHSCIIPHLASGDHGPAGRCKGEVEKQGVINGWEEARRAREQPSKQAGQAHQASAVSAAL